MAVYERVCRRDPPIEFRCTDHAARQSRGDIIAVNHTHKQYKDCVRREFWVVMLGSDLYA